MTIKLIIGLANPGSQYADTRHNAGEWFVERLLDKAEGSWQTEAKFFARHTQGVLHQTPVRLMVPSTYMNESGKAVRLVSQFFKIQPEEILVAHDELDLPVGTARLKLGGGHGGHNGLRHIIESLGTPNFYRLRIGIGHPGNKNQVVDYVLKKPTEDERALIDTAIRDALGVMPQVMGDHIQEAMKALHTG